MAQLNTNLLLLEDPLIDTKKKSSTQIATPTTKTAGSTPAGLNPEQSPGLLSEVGSQLKKKVVSALKVVPPTPQFIDKRVPQAKDIIVSSLQAIPRGAARIAGASEFQAQSKAEQFFYGKEKIGTFAQEGKPLSPIFAQLSASKYNPLLKNVPEDKRQELIDKMSKSTALAGALGILSTTMDVVPDFGGAKTATRAAAKKLLARFGVDTAEQVLKKGGVKLAEEVLQEGGEQILKREGIKVVEQVPPKSSIAKELLTAAEATRNQNENLYHQIDGLLPKIQNDVNLGKASIEDYSTLQKIQQKIASGKATADDLLTARETIKFNQIADAANPTVKVEGKIAGTAKDFKAKVPLEQNPEAGFARLPTAAEVTPKFVEQAKAAMKPVMQFEPEVQDAYRKYVAATLAAKESAQTAFDSTKATLKSAGKNLQEIVDYSAGRATANASKIQKIFDDLYDEATKAGIEIPKRENYLPQMYKNSPEEVQQAVAAYMKDKGVDEHVVAEYLAGKTQLSGEVSKSLKLNPDFAKARVLPDYETAMQYGLQPKYESVEQLAAAYREQLSKVVANKNFLDDLMATGKLTSSRSVGQEVVQLPSMPRPMYADPKLVKFLNQQFSAQDPNAFVKLIAGASRKAQDWSLSGGIPATNFNFFSTGQIIKEITSGNLSAIPAYLRANVDSLSIKWFEKNKDIIRMMAEDGFDVSKRLGGYQHAYDGLLDDRSIGSKLGAGWDKAFSKKTFASFMPQLEIQSYKDTLAAALKSGLSEVEARKLAADTTRAFYGIMEDVGRSKGTENLLSAVFFAPKFRESLVNTLFNTMKSVTTEWSNKAFARNRKLATGMAISFGLYNALNYKLNGHFMWQNESGREFSLKVPTKNGQNAYVEFMPSFLALPRMIGSGTIALAKGDFSTAKQKFGGVFSMPIKIASEIWANKDYFGRPIYQETDSGKQKAWKMAAYVGLSANHPFIRETLKQLGNSENPDITKYTDMVGLKNSEQKPLYQSLSDAAELPIKWRSDLQNQSSEFYKAMDKQAADRKKAVDNVRPTYEKVRQLASSGDTAGAAALVKGLSKEDREIFKTLIASDKRQVATKAKVTVYSKFNQVKELAKAGKKDEAAEILKSLTPEERKAFNSLAEAELK